MRKTVLAAAALVLPLLPQAARAQAPVGPSDRATIIASFQSMFGVDRGADAAAVARALGPPSETVGPPQAPRRYSYRLGPESSIRFDFSADGRRIDEVTIYDVPAAMLRRWLAGRPVRAAMPPMFGESAAAIERRLDRAGLMQAVATPNVPRGADRAIFMSEIREPRLRVQYNCRTPARCEVLNVRWD